MNKHIRNTALLVIVIALSMLTVYHAQATPPAPEKGVNGLPHSPTNQPFQATGTLSLNRPQTQTQPQLVPGTMSEDFEGVWPATGWELSDLSDFDGGEYLWGKRNCHPHTGSFGGWSVGGGATGSALPCTADYPDDAFTWAVYGPFSLAGVTNASLTFHYWGETEGGANCPWDFLFAGSSVDGDNFSGTFFCGDWTSGSAGNGYTQYTLNLNSRLGQNQVWIAFVLGSDFVIAANGMTIDDITLSQTAPTTATPTQVTTPVGTPLSALFLPYLSKPLPTPTPTPTATPLPLPQNLAPVADTTVLQGRPGANYGNFADMLVGYDVTGCHPSIPGFQTSRSLVRFNTSDIPPGTAITQATLHIRKISACWSTAATGETRTVTTYRVASDWAESAVTWNSQPGYAEAQGSTTIPLSFSAPDWYAIDITNLVRGWVDGSIPNQGLALRGPENAGGNIAVFGFATTNWPGTSFDPYISITYADTAVTNSLPAQESPSLPMICEQLPTGITVCRSETDNNPHTFWSAQDD